MTLYYIDADDGDDGGTGAIGDPWQTISKINGSSFSGDDRILFKRGDTWREQLIVPSSGTSGHPITFGAYGSGADPIINGANILSTSGWTLTSVAGETFVSDNFTRTAADWGTASGGTDSDLTWNGSATDWETNGTQGLMQTDYGGRYNFIGDTHTENLLMSLEFSSVTNSSDNRGSGLIFRYDGTNSYRVTYEGSTNTLYLTKWAPTVTELATYAAADLTSGTIKVLVEASGPNVRIQAKVWTGAEPAYQIDYTDSSSPLTSGYFGVQAYNSTDASDVAFDNLSIASPGSTYSYTYQKALTTDPGNAVFENGVRLTKAVSVAAVESTESSFYWAANVIYVHATGSGDPTSNGNTYETSIRDTCITANAKDYITIDGIEAKYAMVEGIILENGSDAGIIQNCTADWNGRAGIAISANGGTDPTSGSILNNIVHNNGKNAATGIGGIQHNIMGAGLISGNIVYSNGDDNWADHGIYGTSNTKLLVVKNNLSYNNAAVGIKAGSATSGMTIEYNITYGNGRAGVYFDAGSAGTDLYNHTDYSSLKGIFLYADGGNVTVDNVKNCIFYAADEHGVLLYENGSNAIITAFTNNEVYGAGTANYSIGTGAINGSASDPTGSNGNISSDPLLNNPAAGDFRLTTGSPCIGAGVDVGLTEDYNGVELGSPPDIGAIEFDPIIMKYRTGATEAACLAASWQTYSAPFSSSGYAQLRAEA